MNRRHRLRGHRRFAELRRTGAMAAAGPARARAQRNHAGSPRAGIAVQGARGAVERNRARRRVRAVLAQVVPALPAVDVVISVPMSVCTMPHRELADCVSSAVRAAAGRCVSR